MKSLCLLPLLAILATPAAAERLSLSGGWQFHRGEASSKTVPADDGAWHAVAVPNDFSIMDKPDGTPPFDKDAISGADSGYLPGGIGWYRRDLTLTAKDAAGTVLLEFEAAYMDADIWLNGNHIPTHHYGYTAFTLDLTGKVRAGVNTVTVRIDHQDPSSRWYAGSGLIRPVHLETLDRLHIDPTGPAVTTPLATVDKGTVVVHTPVVNTAAKPAAVVLTSRIVDGSGRTLAQTEARRSVAAGATVSLDQTLDVAHPALWSTDSPNLYTLVQQVTLNGAVTDSRATRFGIRTVTIDAVRGLLLNGQPLKLRGGNIHHDNYMLGAAGWPDADARKVAVMKAAGYNAIRNAHNPASQATLDAADELGVLVIDEAFDAWNTPKKSLDYARYFKTDWQDDIASLVTTGRNHPSVVFWSIGNEIPEQTTPQGIETAKLLSARVHALDPSRLVSEAVNVDSPANAAQFVTLDIAGYNYRPQYFAGDHQAFPDRIMYTSESTSKDAFAYWQKVDTMPWVIGDFVWTAVDYIGETGIGWMGYSGDWSKLGPYPWHLAYCGEIDATGRKRPAAYYREVLWQTGIDPISAFVRQPDGTADLPDRGLYAAAAPPLDWSLDDVHPSWTWPGEEGKPLDVVVYSEFPEVELFLNGHSLGRKTVDAGSEYKTDFTVPYAPGTLIAVGYRDGQAAGRWQLQTAGAPESLRVTLDKSRLRANGEDLAYVTAQLEDASGVPVYAQSGDLAVTVTVSGAGQLAGAGNGNPYAPESLQSGQMTTFHGRVVAVVRAAASAGTLTVTVAAKGLPLQTVTLPVVAP